MKILEKVALVGIVTTTVLLAGCGPSTPDVDLRAVLDVTADTLESYSATVSEDMNADTIFLGLAEELGRDYNAAEPALHAKPVVVLPQADSSLLAIEDANNNQQADENEDPLWMIEIDGENSRLIATSKSGAVSDHRFSGTSLLAGYLIGSMLTRQRAAGANPASKQTRTAKQAARARAGSGSHAKGK